MKRSVDYFILPIADALAFFIAGLLSLALPLALQRIAPFSEFEILTFASRNRFSDLVYGYLVWSIWFVILKQRHSRRIPFWSEVIEISRVVTTLAFMDLALLALGRFDFSRYVWLVGWISLVPLVPVIRNIGRVIAMRLGFWRRHTWIIGNGPNAQETRTALESERQMGFEIAGLIEPGLVVNHYDGASSRQPFSIKAGPWSPDDTVVIALDAHEHELCPQLVDALTLTGVKNILIIPALRGIPLYGTDVSYFFSHEVLLLDVRNNLEPRFSRTIKRIFDVLVSVVLLIPALGILIPVIVLIFLEDGGPVFFTQKRLGQGGRPFKMLKLRSMKRNADLILEEWKNKNTPEWQEYLRNNFKLRHDSRLLRVGHYARKMSIDELPQIFNVIRGEMSLVGPRPLLPREEEMYGSGIALYKSTRPGITGLWQVSGRSNTSFDQRATMDAWYVRNWSLSFDMVILLRTIAVVLFTRGAF